MPPRMVVDNSKEQVGKEFKRKCREADCHLVTTEAYSPWMQAAEGCIKQVKLGSSRKMVKYGSPKPFWDHCLELEGGIRTHTALDIYGLVGQVPETIMTGETGDISNLCEFEWFQWVMYYEPTKCYPNGKAQIGRWLGPAPDVGTAMTYKMLRSTGWFVHRGTVRAWTPEETANPVFQKMQKDLWIESMIRCGGPLCLLISPRLI